MKKKKKKDKNYSDSYAPDGVVANGWRIVRKGGKIKVNNSYWHSEKLETIVGEQVYFQVYDYWFEKLIIERGACGCHGFYCYAYAECLCCVKQKR
jgi:hypothetical protein